VVIGTKKVAFFDLTKRMHNLIHGSGEPALSPADLALYDEVSTDLAGEFQGWLGPRDVLFIHDPQPAGMGAKVKDALGLRGVWRCHIGLDRDCRRPGWPGGCSSRTSRATSARVSRRPSTFRPR
jgi:trehalose synthase